ncbi:MAG TPA: hypothetical protein DD738_13320 [Ruminiclostridium sp.]|nr:hypothetical protein [Ruminiclostridium sp.]
MKQIKAVDINSIDFSPYGKVYNLRDGGPGVNRSSGDGWTDGYTASSILDTPGSLGNTLGTGTPFSATEMERHFHSQEALFAMDEPIVFLVAPPTKESAPSIKSLQAVIVLPGTVAVLNRMVWHSSAHGLAKPCYYFWHCQVVEHEPTEWKEIFEGTVEVIV